MPGSEDPQERVEQLKERAETADELKHIWDLFDRINGGDDCDAAEQAHAIMIDLYDACAAAEHWLSAEAESPEPGTTKPSDILRLLRDAMSKAEDK